MTERPKREYQIRFFDPVCQCDRVWTYSAPICKHPFNECLAVFRSMPVPAVMLKVETWPDGMRRETIKYVLNFNANGNLELT